MHVFYPAHPWITLDDSQTFVLCCSYFARQFLQIACSGLHYMILRILRKQNKISLLILDEPDKIQIRCVFQKFKVNWSLIAIKRTIYRYKRWLDLFYLGYFVEFCNLQFNISKRQCVKNIFSKILYAPLRLPSLNSPLQHPQKGFSSPYDF